MKPELIIEQVAKETGIKLDKSDPLLAAVFLNKLLLENYGEQLSTSLHKSLLEISSREHEAFSNLQKLLKTRDEKTVNRLENVLGNFVETIEETKNYHESPKNKGIAVTNNFVSIVISLLSGVLMGVCMTYAILR